MKCLLLVAALFPIGLLGQNLADYAIYDTDILSAEFHADRREALRELMPENSVAFIFSSPVRKRANDIYYRYHPDPNLYYLTGYKEPNGVLVLFKESILVDSIRTNELMYVRKAVPTDEIWEGKRLGIKGAQSILGFEYVRTSEQFADMQLDLSSFGAVFTLIPDAHVEDNTRDRGDLASMLKHLNIHLERDSVSASSFGMIELMARLRQQKSSVELEYIRKACEITCEGHNELMRSMKPGMYEYQAQAILEFCFGFLGAESPGFPSICGAGKNACTLHYSDNRKEAKDGELMLVDIGAEYHGYTADVTRTFPVNGKFSTEQLALYNIVLNAHNSAVTLCTSGNKFWDPHDKAVQKIASGLMKLGIIREFKEVFQYYMHGTSHYMGLDVHDAGLNGELKAGQVITVEPGIYIPENSPCDKKWWGIGIRIEDDILITNGTPEILTAESPTKPEEIEKLMKENSKFLNTSKAN